MLRLVLQSPAPDPYFSQPSPRGGPGRWCNLRIVILFINTVVTYVHEEVFKGRGARAKTNTLKSCVLLLCCSDSLVRASPPCRVLGEPCDARPWRTNCPTPLQSRGLHCQGSSNFWLHSLSSRVSVALATPTFRGLLTHLRSSESCHFWESSNIPDSFREYSWLKSQHASNGVRLLKSGCRACPTRMGGAS